MTAKRRNWVYAVLLAGGAIGVIAMGEAGQMPDVFFGIWEALMVVTGFILVYVFSPYGVIFACFFMAKYFMKHYQQTHRKCPYCAKSISSRACVCPYCQRSVEVVLEAPIQHNKDLKDVDLRESFTHRNPPPTS